jgi:hypothetical protein
MLIVESLEEETVAVVLTAVAVLGFSGWVWFVQPYLTRMTANARAADTEDG